jgi:endonuclease/exonuclease/phosphatase family metal-dependent hydrolase
VGRRVAAAFALSLAWGGAGCASLAAPMRALDAPAAAACRIAVDAAGRPSASGVAWTVSARTVDRRALDAWCAAAGPPVVAAAEGSPSPQSGADPVDELVVVSWNLHVGGADLDRLIRRLRAGAFTGGEPVSRFVLLLQEAHRAGVLVPRVGGPAPRAIRPAAGHQRADVVTTATRAGLALYYVPSMRNGGSPQTDEDRGNAILSTEALHELTAVELPFERQRRVAAAATIRLRTADGGEWPLRVVSAHFESTIPARRLWVFAARARARQARGLLGALPADSPVVVGGDFNTWFGFADSAYRILAAAVPDAAGADRRPTFGRWFRLDHLFSRVPAGWRAVGGRLDDRLGSDHFPLLARLRPVADAAGAALSRAYNSRAPRAGRAPDGTRHGAGPVLPERLR